ncbi:MAG: glycosyltransferase, partial [Henriciella sp.]|uniref:glycosyltransferase n=1 Tax=Henriciella sp. TaxID=1968823 RepID=UPI003C723FD7
VSQFLSVGTIEPRKGHSVILDAFESLWEKGIDSELHIIGREGWGVETFVQRLKHHPEFGLRLHWRANLDDEALGEAYRNAAAVICASYAEGFGLPLIEADYFGVPIIASNIPVFKEVASSIDRASFFDVGDSAALAESVSSFLSQPKSGASKAASTSSRNHLTWKESTQALLARIQSDEWYKVYEPNYIEELNADSSLHKTTMNRPLTNVVKPIAELRMVGDGEFLLNGVGLSFSVRNLSTQGWSGEGQHGVSIAMMVRDRRGQAMGNEAFKGYLPFCLPPGRIYTRKMGIPLDLINAGACEAVVGVFQDGNGFLSKPLRIDLMDAIPAALQPDWIFFENA